MTKIVIVSGIQIINNPRVVKEATALAEAGFDVEVIGAIYDVESVERIERMLSRVQWRHTPVVDLGSGGSGDRLYYLYARIRRKFALLQKKWFNMENPNQLGYFVRRLYRIAKRRKADLYIVHLEQALWAGNRLLENGYNVAVDVEDWYSEHGLPDDMIMKPVHLMKSYERYLFQNAAYSTTTSKALSSEIAREYECQPPTVVYNSFPMEERKEIDGEFLDKRKLNVPSIIWFSQTVGPGRGLEELVSALQQLDCPFELHVRGTPRQGYIESLLETVPDSLEEKIYFHPQVPQDELLSRLSEHDIGYCGELSDSRNHDLTIAIKTLEYLRAGLAVVVSDTAGHLEVASFVESGVMIYQQSDTTSLAAVLLELLTDESRLREAKAAALRGLAGELNWDVSASRIVKLAQAATAE